MPSFQISLSPTKRAAGRFVGKVRRALQQAFAEENRERGLTQSQIARELGVHRSVINRELRGDKDITLGRVGELARILGRRIEFSLPKLEESKGNHNGFTLEVPPRPSGSSSRTASNANALELESV